MNDENLLNDYIATHKMGDEEFHEYVSSIIPSIQKRLNDTITDNVYVELCDKIKVYITGKQYEFNYKQFNEVMAVHNINLEDELVNGISYELTNR